MKLKSEISGFRAFLDILNAAPIRAAKLNISAWAIELYKSAVSAVSLVNFEETTEHGFAAVLVNLAFISSRTQRDEWDGYVSGSLGYWKDNKWHSQNPC